MIKIVRPSAPDFLTDEAKKWHKETQDAITHYASENTSQFSFKHYRDKDLKDALMQIFKKCAYCGSSYSAVFDGDVEHFRPKGRVNEKKPQTPGYYWLSNDWDNLFIACQHCNQNRKHQLYDEKILRTMGKLDQFPLKIEDYRAKCHACSLEEEEKHRLLINPCVDDPDDHFEYEDKEAVIIPLSDKGKASIEVYVLQRPYLVQERKKQMLFLFSAIQNVKDMLELYNEYQTENFKNRLEKSIENLLMYTKDDVQYAGMSRFFVKKFLLANGLI